MKSVKLSEAQKRVISLMREGYELGTYSGFHSSVNLQLGGCGKGGKTAGITFGTFHAILDKKLVEHTTAVFERPCRYKLTELGKTINID